MPIGVRSITLQPDAMNKLPEGDNNYELVRLKRAVIRSTYEKGSEKLNFTMNLDFRARILTVDVNAPAAKIYDVANELIFSLGTLARRQIAQPATNQIEGGSKLRMNVEDADQVLGLLHNIKEVGGPGRNPVVPRFG